MAFDKVIDSVKLDAALTETANAIRAKTSDTKPITWDESEGFKTAVDSIDTETIYDKGYVDGKNSVYNGFWDNFQDYGNRVSYVRAFMSYWDDNIFAPKYNMQPTNAQEMFLGCEITDLKGICEKQGITLDFSKATNTANLFNTSTVTKVGTIDLSSAASGNQIFYKCTKLESVDLIVCTAIHTFDKAFSNCGKLKEIRFGGEIGKPLNLQHSSLLSNESVQSIIDGLADLTGGTAQTVDFHSDIADKLTDEQLTQIYNKNWRVI